MAHSQYTSISFHVPTSFALSPCMQGKIRVYCRARPMSKDEAARGDASVVSFPDESTIDVSGLKGREGKSFLFDRCFGPASSQEEVFSDVENLMQSTYDGFNVSIFAYGQTGRCLGCGGLRGPSCDRQTEGCRYCIASISCLSSYLSLDCRSGKTFTMVGGRDCPGITPRALRRLFAIIDTERAKGTSDVRVEAYMVELYLDSLEDLFFKLDNPRARPDDVPKLEIKKDDKGCVVRSS